MPLEIYLQREADPDAAIALSFLLIVVAAVVVVGVGSSRLGGWSSSVPSRG
jgi:molybdate transport system permease protein